MWKRSLLFVPVLLIPTWICFAQLAGNFPISFEILLFKWLLLIIGLAGMFGYE